MWRAATPTVVVSMMIAVRWGECPRVGQNVSEIGLHSRKHRVFVLNPCELEARARLSPKWGVPSPCCCAVWGVQNIFVCNPERWNKAFASNHRLQPLNEPKQQSNSTRSEMKKFHTLCPEFFPEKTRSLKLTGQVAVFGQVLHFLLGFTVHCFQLQNRRIFFISFLLPSFHFSGFQFVLLQKFLTAIDHSTVVFPPFEKAAAIPVEPDQKWTSQLSFAFWKPLPRRRRASGRTRRHRRGARSTHTPSGRSPHERRDHGDGRRLHRPSTHSCACRGVEAGPSALTSTSLRPRGKPSASQARGCWHLPQACGAGAVMSLGVDLFRLKCATCSPKAAACTAGMRCPSGGRWVSCDDNCKECSWMACVK